MPTIEMLQLLVYGGPGMVLFGIFIFWYLPNKEKRHADTIQRIHSEDHSRLEEIIERQARQIRELGRDVLISALVSQGVPDTEAELRAKRIISNGN